MKSLWEIHTCQYEYLLYVRGYFLKIKTLPAFSHPVILTYKSRPVTQTYVDWLSPCNLPGFHPNTHTHTDGKGLSITKNHRVMGLQYQHKITHTEISVTCTWEDSHTHTHTHTHTQGCVQGCQVCVFGMWGMCVGQHVGRSACWVESLSVRCVITTLRLQSAI